MHEMAHILGLGHSDETWNEFILGTCPSDPNSVINGGNAYNWCNFPKILSSCDKEALELLYECPSKPKPTSGTISFDDYIACTNMSIQPGEIINIDTTVNKVSNYYLDFSHLRGSCSHKN